MAFGPGRPADAAQMGDPFGEVGVPNPRQTMAQAQVPGMGLGAGAMPGHAENMQAEQIRRAKLRKLAELRARGMEAPDAQVIDQDVYGQGLTESLYGGEMGQDYGPIDPTRSRLPRGF